MRPAGWTHSEDARRKISAAAQKRRYTTVVVYLPCERPGCGNEIVLTSKRLTKRFCSPDCRRGMKHSTESKLKMSQRRAGKGRPMTPVEDRFWPKVEVAGPDECWLWKGAAGEHGYGLIGLGGRKGGAVTVTRLSYQIAYGPFDSSLNVLHRCDTPACVNPSHLFLGTQAENIRDMINKGRARWQKTGGRLVQD